MSSVFFFNMLRVLLFFFYILIQSSYVFFVFPHCVKFVVNVRTSTDHHLFFFSKRVIFFVKQPFTDSEHFRIAFSISFNDSTFLWPASMLLYPFLHQVQLLTVNVPMVVLHFAL